MMRFLASLLLAVLLCGVAQADLSPAAEDRGRLSLAWDAHESGLCEEVLAYVGEIKPGSEAAPEGLWLKADCLRSLGRYGDAVSVLESPVGRTARDWRNLLRSALEDWVWEATAKENYADALSILQRGLASLAGEPTLLALRGATSFRREVCDSLRATRLGPGSHHLTGGEEIFFRKGRSAPEGKGWVRVYPWRGETTWVPEITLEEWMPSLAERLRREGKSLWMRLPGNSIDRSLSAEARKQGLLARASADGFRLAQGENEVCWSRSEWTFRAAIEGLGISGAVVDSVARAVTTLKARKALVEWVNENRGPLSVHEDGPLLRLRHPSTARTYELEADSWASVYDLQTKEWTDFWGDLVVELGRKPGAFRCFCGREALIRETLTHEPGHALVVEKGRGYAVVLTALCPLHQQSVTAELLKEWGVSLTQAWARARKDAGEKPWDLSFERGEEGGTHYLALQGEGASSLARRPDLLLGALEAVEGREVRGTSVQVLAPTTSSLVVVSERVTPGKAQAAATRALLRGARRGEVVDRLGYRTTLQLPRKASGVFEVHSSEGP